MAKLKATMYHLIRSYISNHSNNNCHCSSKNRADDDNNNNNNNNNNNKSVSDSMVKTFDSFKDSFTE
jgi:hypothetical protein